MIGEFFKNLVYKIMDPIDSLLKPFKIDVSSFFSYILAIITACLALDRLLELFSVLFTGQFVNYWSPFGYTLALFILTSGYAVLCASPFCKTILLPIKYYVYYSIAFRIIVSAMVAQWVNELSWYFLMNFSNFKYIATNMPELIAPAISSLTWLFPIFMIKASIYYYLNGVMDADQDWIDSFEDYKGFKLIPAKSTVKTPDVFLCNAPICLDDKTGKMAFIPESKRFEATLVEGATGTGKTATIVEPMCAMDLERKYFFREVSKKLAYNALNAKLATLAVPYSNEYLNRNFTLSYLKPVDSRINEYKNYVKDMFKYMDPSTKQMYYRGIGFTLVAPDNACIERVKKVANSFEIDINIIDPMDPNSFGINPFIGTDPAKVASIISTVLKGMYESENASSNNVFFANVTQQAFENLAILLKLVYPKMHEGSLPTLEDMLSILNNFDMAEEMTEFLKKDSELSNDYKSLIGYFEKNFYKPPVNIHGYEIASTYGSGRKDTEKFVYGAITQLDNFLRNPGIKRVLCSRDNNIDLDRALAEGQVITACTRQGDLGEIHQKAFGMFVILSLKDAVLRRPGTEDTRTPHFVYIDEFPLYVNKDTEAFFTLFRKYRCGTLVTIQNLSQLTKTSSLAYFKDVIITNTKTQIVFGDLTFEESKFWADEMGTKKKWKYKRVLADSSTQEGADKVTSMFMGAEIDYPQNYKPAKFIKLGFKMCIYKTKNDSGANIVGRGKTDFINKQYYEPHKSAKYNFSAYTSTSSDNASTLSSQSSNTNSDGNAINNIPEGESIFTIRDNRFFSGGNDGEEIFIDIDRDGTNDFVVESLNTKNSANVNMQDISNDDDSSIIIDLKRK